MSFIVLSKLADNKESFVMKVRGEIIKLPI